MKQTDYRLAVIMYTDIVGFSKMMGENEAETLNVLRTHNRILDEAVEACHGTVIKTIGDAYMVDFRNTVEALQCAVEVQEKIYEYNKQTGSYILLVRIGLHLGDIYFYEKDAFGDGINIAARLQSFAKPGCICFSQDVFNQVLNKVDFHAEKLGRVSLKNINKEIHAYEIETKNTEFDTENEKAGIENLVNKLYEMLSEGFFPWAAIVSFAWGIGLVSNFVEIFTEYKKSKELQTILPLNEEEFSLYLRIAKHRSDYIQHLCSTITIPLFLRFLHVLFSFSFPWHLIVTAVLVFGLIMNSINYIPKRTKYVDQLCELKNCDNWRSLFE